MWRSTFLLATEAGNASPRTAKAEPTGPGRTRRRGLHPGSQLSEAPRHEAMWRRPLPAEMVSFPRDIAIKWGIQIPLLDHQKKLKEMWRKVDRLPRSENEVFSAVSSSVGLTALIFPKARNLRCGIIIFPRRLGGHWVSDWFQQSFLWSVGSAQVLRWWLTKVSLNQSLNPRSCGTTIVPHNGWWNAEDDQVCRNFRISKFHPHSNEPMPLFLEANFSELRGSSV